MLKVLLAAHLLLAIFTIGPLVHAVTTASRGIRHGDGAATAAAARMTKIYGYASVLVPLVGFALMSQKRRGQQLGDFEDTWIWLSALLWLVATIIVLGEIVPTLEKVTEKIGNEESVVALTARVAAVGGVVALIFATIVVLMVYKPGR
ncbi:MAG TPA: hypothetical protein VJ831_11270 [Jatrophihabitantaceae bacterium]|nr:hypothetical protein [Jatrophihabitantaceae bacterium]